MSARVAVRPSPSLSSFSLLSRSLPPVPPPIVPLNHEADRDKEDEIYITSASVIELDSRKCSDNDSYDSGIYNASTNTGCSSSSCSDKSSRSRRHISSTFIKLVSQDEDNGDYEHQEMSVWLDLANGHDEESGSDGEEESVYETLSEDVFSKGSNDSTNDKEDLSLTKIAEAAGRGIKKLRRNWSIKKDDLTKGLSKIKKSSITILEDVYTKEVKFSSVGRRKLSMSQLLSSSSDNSQVQSHVSNFYVGLQPDLSSAAQSRIAPTFSRSSSVLSDISESEIVSDFSSPPSSLPPNICQGVIKERPLRPRRRSAKGKVVTRPVSRPCEPPPPPPINLSTHPLHSLQSLAAEVSQTLQEMTMAHDTTISLLNNSDQQQNSNDDDEQIYFSRLMPNEPLYQFYETLPLPLHNTDDVDDDGTNQDYSPSSDLTSSTQNTPTSFQTRFTPGDIVSQSGQRSLWSDMPQVTASHKLLTISPALRRFQEAKFEIISSEASYLKSLNVLVSHFANSSKLRHNSQVLSQDEWSAVFSNIYQIRECSEKFLQSLETCWQRSIMMHGLSELLLAAARSEFQVFIEYCSNQAVQERTLKKLKNANSNFALVLQELESSPVCQSLSLHSFLMLPMQRITRLPLLTSAIINHCCQSNNEEEDSLFSERIVFDECLKVLNNLVTKCNEGARHRERQDQLVKINSNLDFKDVPWLYLVTPGRWLVKEISCTRICWREAPDKITWGRKVSKQRLQLLLFTDLLVVCKKKRDEKLQVLDYCQRNLLDLSAVELSSSVTGVGMGALISSVAGSGMTGSSSSVKSAAWLTLIQNSSKKTCEMIVLFDSAEDRSALLELVQPSLVNNGEKIYECWDCPNVEIIQDYQPTQEDHLPVRQGDIANVLRKSDEGMMYVETSDGGSQGWIPSNIVRELQSDHMRARNFKQRYQFLKALAELDMAEK